MKPLRIAFYGVEIREVKKCLEFAFNLTQNRSF